MFKYRSKSFDFRRLHRDCASDVDTSSSLLGPLSNKAVIVFICNNHLFKLDLTYIDLSVNILNSLDWRFALRSGIFDLYNVLV